MTATSKFLILGTDIVDSKDRRKSDVYIEDGKISQVEKAGELSSSNFSGAHVIDADGLVLSPGIVDIQVHFREPGREEAEDIETGSRSAAVGGMVAVQTMANTYPRVDSVETYLDIKERSKKAHCDVYQAAAITKNLESEELSDMQGLYEAGARTFTDDGECVKTARVMREAIETLSNFDDVILAQHCEDHSLVHDGVMDEGEISAQLGLPGRHRVAEEIIIERDIALMKAFASQKLRYHVLHISTKEGLEAVRRGQEQGVRVTTEVAPQHTVLTSDLLLSGNTSFKMNPPMRTKADTQALREGLADGSISAIATDHAPHPPEMKEQGLLLAPPGMLGVETALSVGITHLVKTGVLTLQELIKVMSINPARIINADRDGHGLDIVPGNPANLVLFDENEKWIIDSQQLHSKSLNSPWEGNELSGKVLYTFLRGQMTCEKGNPTK